MSSNLSPVMPRLRQEYSVQRRDLGWAASKQAEQAVCRQALASCPCRACRASERAFCPVLEGLSRDHGKGLGPEGARPQGACAGQGPSAFARSLRGPGGGDVDAAAVLLGTKICFPAHSSYFQWARAARCSPLNKHHEHGNSRKEDGSIDSFEFCIQ